MEGTLKAFCENPGGDKNEGSPCPYCKKSNHQPNKCWWRPDIKCRKCGNMGHMEKVCKSKESRETAKGAYVEDEEILFQVFK